MNHRYTIVTLSELLAVARDGEQGFLTCAEHARSDTLRRIFVRRAGRAAAAAAELRELIAELGGDPGMRARIVGPMRRAWMNLHTALAQNNDDALVEECEHGEDHALEVYRNALDDPLPELVRHTILRQFEDMMSDHGQIRFPASELIQGGLRAASTGGHARP
jgi:uncharacterized protein (TIGR02284 family)